MLETRCRRDIRAAISFNLHPATRAQNAVPVLENGWLLFAVLADTHLFLPEKYFGVCLPAIHPLTFVIRWTAAWQRPNHLRRSSRIKVQGLLRWVVARNADAFSACVRRS